MYNCQWSSTTDLTSNDPFPLTLFHEQSMNNQFFFNQNIQKVLSVAFLFRCLWAWKVCQQKWEVEASGDVKCSLMLGSPPTWMKTFNGEFPVFAPIFIFYSSCQTVAGVSTRIRRKVLYQGADDRLLSDMISLMRESCLDAATMAVGSGRWWRRRGGESGWWYVTHSRRWSVKKKKEKKITGEKYIKRFEPLSCR